MHHEIDDIALESSRNGGICRWSLARCSCINIEEDVRNVNFMCPRLDKEEVCKCSIPETISMERVLQETRNSPLKIEVREGCDAKAVVLGV
jgi:hypothetical protein